MSFNNRKKREIEKAKAEERKQVKNRKL